MPHAKTRQPRPIISRDKRRYRPASDSLESVGNSSNHHINRPYLWRDTVNRRTSSPLVTQNGAIGRSAEADKLSVANIEEDRLGVLLSNFPTIFLVRPESRSQTCCNSASQWVASFNTFVATSMRRENESSCRSLTSSSSRFAV